MQNFKAMYSFQYLEMLYRNTGLTECHVDQERPAARHDGLFLLLLGSSIDDVANEEFTWINYLCSNGCKKVT
jgi:hypothetical protein